MARLVDHLTEAKIRNVLRPACLRLAKAFNCKCERRCTVAAKKKPPLVAGASA
jgi:hypothetical protein